MEGRSLTAHKSVQDVLLRGQEALSGPGARVTGMSFLVSRPVKSRIQITWIHSPAAANSMILLRASFRGLGSALTFSFIALHESALFGKHRHLGSSRVELPPRHVCQFQALGPPCLGELTWSVSGMQGRLHLFYPIVAESWYTTWMDQHHHVITPVVGAHSASLTLMRSWDARITDP